MPAPSTNSRRRPSGACPERATPAGFVRPSFQAVPGCLAVGAPGMLSRSSRLRECARP